MEHCESDMREAACGLHSAGCDVWHTTGVSGICTLIAPFFTDGPRFLGGIDDAAAVAVAVAVAGGGRDGEKPPG